MRVIGFERPSGFGWILGLCLGLLACDDEARPRVEVEPDAAADSAWIDAALLDAALLDAALLDAAPLDAAPLDAAPLDAALLDASPLDASPLDAAPLDASPLDAALFDAALFDAALDAAPLDAEVPVLTALSGEARAADQRLEVTVRLGDARTVTVDGTWRLDAPPGRWILTFEAPEHEVITREVVVEAGPQVVEPVLLYRGTRLGPPAGGLVQFIGDQVLWSEGDTLLASPTAAVAPRTLIERGFELLLGTSPAQDAVVARLQGAPGIAGDLVVVALADGAQQSLFEEAQPWVRWQPDGSVMGMVQTREALSRLVVGRPAQPARVLAEGVPWLLVTELADGTPVWAERAENGFEINGLRGDGAVPLAPGFPSSDAFLSTTPGRTGLIWLSPTGELVRYEPDQTRVLAPDVLPTPRPRFVGQRLVFFRADDAGPGLRQIHLLDGAGARLLLDAAEGDSLAVVGDRWYATRPDDGLWTGTLAGEPGVRVLPGNVVRFLPEGPGVVALADGAAWRLVPGRAAEPLQVDGLAQLSPVPTGATAWQAATRSLWYLPGPERALPPSALVEGAPRANRVLEPGGRALYVLGAQGFFRAPLPPGAPTTAFEVETTTLAPIDATRLLGWQEGQALHQIDPRTGAAFGWAASVTRVVPHPAGTFAVYVSDRGTYLAPITP